jgi:hypothetical protein
MVAVPEVTTSPFPTFSAGTRKKYPSAVSVALPDLATVCKRLSR